MTRTKIVTPSRSWRTFHSLLRATPPVSSCFPPPGHSFRHPPDEQTGRIAHHPPHDVTNTVHPACTLFTVEALLHKSTHLQIPSLPNLLVWPFSFPSHLAFKSSRSRSRRKQNASICPKEDREGEAGCFFVFFWQRRGRGDACYGRGVHHVFFSG